MDMLKTSVLFLFYFSITFCQDAIIEIQNGLVRGQRMSKHMYGFRGIPYAKPPINDLRFEPPQEPDNWTDVWDATRDTNICMQIGMNSDLILTTLSTGSEDCLYINVYIPQLPKSDVAFPVMVWIYGGIFLLGASNYNIYDPDHLVEQNIIFVSLSYRLGVFGFLSTNDEAAPGNNGLKDQILALKWVQRNIKAFGGDPHSVTIAGESAGSASASYLLMSPLAKGLFRGAIMESGTALCLWSLAQRTREAAYLLGHSFGIITNNSSELVTRLKHVPTTQLQIMSINIMALIMISNPINNLIYGPVIEQPSENAVISENSYEAFSKGHFHKVPTIIGFNSREGMDVLPSVIRDSGYIFTYDLILARLVPASMNIPSTQFNTLNKIGKKIKEYYAGTKGNMNFPDDTNFLVYITGNEFMRPIRKTAELMAKYSTVYFYRFSYISTPNATGASHAEELFYLFSSRRNSESDVAMRRCMVGLWTNFVKYNDPNVARGICAGNPTWLPVNLKETSGNYYLSIDENPTLERNANRDEYNFWENLFTKYGNPPYSRY